MTATREAPGSADEIAALLLEAAEAGRTVRPVGGGTKLDWGPPAADVDLSTAGLSGIIEHNEGDLTAIVGAGTPLAEAQERFTAVGQMLALDPPDPGGATFGGVLAAADSGPLRHRYGGIRDLVLGVRVALVDGTVARAGSKVIKNVAGYDLAKLLCGSMGTLGVACEVIVRLHPRPEQTVTARATTDEPATLARAARAVAGASLELDRLDVAWRDGAGTLLAQGAGRAGEAQAAAAAEAMTAAGLAAELVSDDGPVWAAQRDAQRGDVVLKVAALPTDLEALIRATRDAGGVLVGRAALGLSWIALPSPEATEVARVRAAAGPSPVVVQDGPPELRAPRHEAAPPGTTALMRRVKLRFDPTGTLGGLP